MIVTIVGSMSRKEYMEEIKSCFKKMGFEVNSPVDDQLKKLPLLTIQKKWIEKIEEADFIIAVPKINKLENSGSASQMMTFGESTSYEIAIATRFGKPILIG